MAAADFKHRRLNTFSTFSQLKFKWQCANLREVNAASSYCRAVKFRSSCSSPLYILAITASKSLKSILPLANFSVEQIVKAGNGNGIAAIGLILSSILTSRGCSRHASKTFFISQEHMNNSMWNATIHQILQRQIDRFNFIFPVYFTYRRTFLPNDASSP